MNIKYRNLKFQSTPPLSAVSSAQNSVEISCSEKSEVVIKVTYSASNVTAPFRVIFLDENAKETISAQVTPANSGSTESSRYLGEAFSLPTLGAKAFKIRLDGVPTNSGNASAYGSAV